MDGCSLGLLDDIDKGIEAGLIEVTGYNKDDEERIVRFTREGLDYLVNCLNKYFHS